MSILDNMVSAQTINRGHAVDKALAPYCALAAVGFPGGGGVHHRDGLHAAIQGTPRWLDSALAQTAREHGPACALAEAYRQAGVGCLDKVSGAFALSLMDESNRRSLVAIDRLGIGSLFFTLRQGQLIFASNARAILCHPDADSGIDPQGIFDYLYFHMVPGPRSIFAGIEKLLPGQCLIAEDGKVDRRFYWQPTYVDTPASDLEKLEADFRGLLEAAVGRATEGIKAGAFLSGGTDSSTIAGMFRKRYGEPVDTYSIGFHAEGFDEMEYARIAARHFATRPHEYYLTPQDVVDAVPAIAKAYDEPFGNASAVPAYYCAKLARADGMDALLAGDGGDELFGGNARYAKQRVFEFYQRIPKPLRDYLVEPAAFKFPFAEKLWPLAKAQSYIKQANIPLPDRLESYNFLNRMPLADIFDADFLATVDTGEPLGYLRETYAQAQAATSLNRMLYVDLKFTLADSDLRKVNRMCELAQIDVRYPLLDDEVLRFSTELPTSLKLRGQELRYFFKHALRDFLPAEILAKSKHGFGLPFGLWMDTHGPLRDLARENLGALCRRGIVRAAFVEELQKRHREYPSYYGVMIWVLLMLEQWLQSL